MKASIHYKKKICVEWKSKKKTIMKKITETDCHRRNLIAKLYHKKKKKNTYLSIEQTCKVEEKEKVVRWKERKKNK